MALRRVRDSWTATSRRLIPLFSDSQAPKSNTQNVVITHVGESSESISWPRCPRSITVTRF